jgi:hypothetical protein
MIRLLREHEGPPARRFKANTNAILEAAIKVQEIGMLATQILDSLLGIGAHERQ